MFRHLPKWNQEDSAGTGKTLLVKNGELFKRKTFHVFDDAAEYFYAPELASSLNMPKLQRLKKKLS